MGRSRGAACAAARRVARPPQRRGAARHARIGLRLRLRSRLVALLVAAGLATRVGGVRASAACATARLAGASETQGRKGAHTHRSGHAARAGGAAAGPRRNSTARSERSRRSGARPANIAAGRPAGTRCASCRLRQRRGPRQRRREAHHDSFRSEQRAGIAPVQLFLAGCDAASARLHARRPDGVSARAMASSSLLVRDLDGRTRCLVLSNPGRAAVPGSDALRAVSRATGLPAGAFRLVTGTREVTAQGQPLPCDAQGGLPTCTVLLRLCGGKARAHAAQRRAWPRKRAPLTHPTLPRTLRVAGRLWLAAARRGQGRQDHKQRRRLPRPVRPPHARRQRRDQAHGVAGACCVAD